MLKGGGGGVNPLPPTPFCCWFLFKCLIDDIFFSSFLNGKVPYLRFGFDQFAGFPVEAGPLQEEAVDVDTLGRRVVDVLTWKPRHQVLRSKSWHFKRDSHGIFFLSFLSPDSTDQKLTFKNKRQSWDIFFLLFSCIFSCIYVADNTVHCQQKLNWQINWQELLMRGRWHCQEKLTWQITLTRVSYIWQITLARAAYTWQITLSRPAYTWQITLSRPAYTWQMTLSRAAYTWQMTLSRAQPLCRRVTSCLMAVKNPCGLKKPVTQNTWKDKKKSCFCIKHLKHSSFLGKICKISFFSTGHRQN